MARLECQVHHNALQPPLIVAHVVPNKDCMLLSSGTTRMCSIPEGRYVGKFLNRIALSCSQPMACHRRRAWSLLRRCYNKREQGMGKCRPWRRRAGRHHPDFVQGWGSQAVTPGGEAHEHEIGRHKPSW